MVTVCSPPEAECLGHEASTTPSVVSSGYESPSPSWSSRVANRKWPLVVAGVMLVAGMVFMVAWTPLILHNGSWNMGDDEWGIFRGAHYVGWGYLGGIYTPSNGIISFPGMSVLLAPLAMLSGTLHLTESYPPYFLTQPTAALLLQPAELLLASTVVFAADALAECLEVARRRRVALSFTIGLIAWPTAAIWGHAEDSLAMTFALYALVAFLQKKWTALWMAIGVGDPDAAVGGPLGPAAGWSFTARDTMVAGDPLCLTFRRPGSGGIHR